MWPNKVLDENGQAMNPQRRLGLVATGAPACVAQSASLRRVHGIFGKGQGEGEATGSIRRFTSRGGENLFETCSRRSILKKEYIYGIGSLLVGFAVFLGAALSWSGGLMHEMTHNLPGLMLGLMLFIVSFVFFTADPKTSPQTSSARN